jgi:hypothetical protein
MLASITSSIISRGYLYLGGDVGFVATAHNSIVMTEKYEVKSYLFRIDIDLACVSIL